MTSPAALVPGIAVHQDQPGGGDVQSQAKQRQQQQGRGKNAEFHRLADVQRDHHHDDRGHDVGHDQDIEHQPGNGVMRAMTIISTARERPVPEIQELEGARNLPKSRSRDGAARTWQCRGARECFRLPP